MEPALFEDDRALARRLAGGDDAAFEQFFSEYFPRLHRFTFARLGPDPSVVEDVVQETLSIAIRQIHTYRGEAALFSWLCTICRRALARRERSERATRERVVLFDDDRDLRAVVESLGATQEARTRAGDLRDSVHAALDLLPDRYARSLEWKYLEDLSVADVAARLGVSAKAAESVLTRARDAFREVFRALGGRAAPRTEP